MIYSLSEFGVLVCFCYVNYRDVIDKPMPRGEIVVGGNSVTSDYFNNQAKTDEVYMVVKHAIAHRELFFFPYRFNMKISG